MVVEVVVIAMTHDTDRLAFHSISDDHLEVRTYCKYWLTARHAALAGGPS